MKSPLFFAFMIATSALGQYVITEVPCGEGAEGVGGLTDRGALAAICAVNTNPAFQPAFLAFLIDRTGPHDLGLGTLGVLVAGVTGINKHEQVIANRLYPGNERAYLYSRGSITDLGTLGGSSSFAWGIDDLGQIVGWAALADETVHAFLYRKGIMHDLGAFGASASAAAAINGRGQIVINRIFETNGSTVIVAGIYSEGVLQDIGSLGGAYTEGLGINALGHVVGNALPADMRELHAFFFHDGQMEDLSMAPTHLPDTGASIRSINDFDEMVGSWFREFDAETVYGGFLYKEGIRTDISELLPPNSGWTIRSADAINNLGQITGIGYYNGSPRIYLLSPAKAHGR